jgi:hypothetical protein
MRRHPRGFRRSVDRGIRGQSIEPRNVDGPGCRRCRDKRKATRVGAFMASAVRPCVVRDLSHAGKPPAREPGYPLAGRWGSPSHFGPHREGRTRNPMTYSQGKSDSPIVPMKSPNKAARGNYSPHCGVSGIRSVCCWVSSNAGKRESMRPQASIGTDRSLAGLAMPSILSPSLSTSENKIYVRVRSSFKRASATCQLFSTGFRRVSCRWMRRGATSS